MAKEFKVANADETKPAVNLTHKKGEAFTSTVSVETDALTVTEAAEELAREKFDLVASAENVTLDNVRLVKVCHRIGTSAEFTFEGQVK